jgi:hypothetical protein
MNDSSQDCRVDKWAKPDPDTKIHVYIWGYLPHSINHYQEIMCL